MGRKFVELAVARQESDGYAIVLEDLKRRRRVAPRRERVDRCYRRVAFDLREAGTAYHGDVDGPWRYLLAWLTLTPVSLTNCRTCRGSHGRSF